MASSKTLTIPFAEEHLDKIKAAAKTEFRSVAAYIRALVLKDLHEKGHITLTPGAEPTDKS